MYTFEAFRCKRIATENFMFTELFQYIWYSLFKKQKVVVIHYDLVLVKIITTKNYSHF